MNILVLNCGSSTVKFQIIESDPERVQNGSERRLASGLLERIGSQALITFKVEGQPPHKSTAPLKDHRAAIDKVLRWIVSPEARIESIRALSDLDAVGHRVVHGGEKFQKSMLIDEKVLAGIEDCIELAPLHNPANLKGIRACQDLLGGGVPQVAVFDTAFHSTLPETAYLYGLPYHLYLRHRIRRYGFHGTSHRYIAFRYGQMMGLEPKDVNIVSLHLGNGCSACAIKNGRSIDTSMGFTPLEGLIMGTRAGDVDPSIVDFLHSKEGLSIGEIDTMLNKQSGLLGVSGLTSDLRELEEEEEHNQDRRARLAIDLFCRRVQKYVGSYLAVMNGADAVVFTGGIGQNSDVVRRRVCANMDWLGLKLDDQKNRTLPRGEAGDISAEDSRVRILALPTDEELMIAQDTVRCVAGPARG